MFYKEPKVMLFTSVKRSLFLFVTVLKSRTNINFLITYLLLSIQILYNRCKVFIDLMILKTSIGCCKPFLTIQK